MKFRYSDEEKAIAVSAADVASFARSKGSAPLFIPFGGSMPEEPSHDVPLEIRTEADGCAVVISDVCDAVWAESEDVPVPVIGIRREKRKRQSAQKIARTLEPYAAVLGHMFASVNGCAAVRLVLSLEESDGTAARFEWVASAETLGGIFGALLLRAAPFFALCARHAEALPEFCSLPFPFPSIREGQRDFINEAYRAIKTGRRLLCSAPTGIGKTMSALYPAVRAIGSGHCDKIFCLCAKNVTGKAAADAAGTLASLLPELRCVTVIAKERMCAFREEGFSPMRCRRGCVLTAMTAGASYEARRDAALLELFGSGNVYTPEAIQKVAEQYYVCPYELSLDLSEYCDVVICDYNYAFDYSIRFRRYFADVREKYVFLIDEAHNLPKRARDTYSASMDEGILDRVRELIDGEYPGDTELEDSLEVLRVAFGGVRRCVKSETELTEEGAYGFYRSGEVPKLLVEAVSVLSRTVGTKLNDRTVVSRATEKLDTELKKFIAVCGLFDEHYTFFAEGNDESLTVRLICLDPAMVLDRAMGAARSVILFSATLSPIDYFADVCGCADATVLELESPYEQGNLMLAAVDSVATTLSERAGSAPEVAELIMSVVDGREGNYIVYFPSYAYLDRVAKIFCRMADGVTVVKQKPGMDRAERKAFLAAFENGGDGGTVVGFCVLGGMFSEGIDLAGEKLIGAIIVGTGMGSITSEQNILKEYYDATRENGMDYAYVYPGFNNVLQAAGRVIRSETDRGIVVLIDERYADPHMQRLFPKHWHHIKFTGDPFALQEMIDRFWESE